MKKFQLKKRKEVKLPPRITNETVAEHRERILAGGRRFKYPIQYSRHRLVINTILISIVALVLAVVLAWQQLYLAQNSSDFFYRVTRAIPVPVASVDGQSVRYSDYLMRYRSSLHALESMKQLDLATVQGKRQAESIKALAMDSAVADAYAVKLAEEQDIRVEDRRVNDFQKQSQAGLSEDAYRSVTKDLLNWSPEESRHIIHLTLLRQDVAFAIDEKAAANKQKAQELISQGKKLEEVASALGEGVVVNDQGFVPKDNEDGGLTRAAANLQAGKTSGPIRTSAGDGYYFVTLLEARDEQIHYKYLKIPLAEFDENLAELHKNDKVKYYIKVNKESATAPTEGE